MSAAWATRRIRKSRFNNNRQRARWARLHRAHLLKAQRRAGKYGGRPVLAGTLLFYGAVDAFVRIMARLRTRLLPFRELLRSVNTSLPLVSIVVPSWQKGRFLRHALESLLQQTYPHVEIIVQDNCSTDETTALLAEYAPRLAHVHRENDTGQSDALCRGFARCRGEIIGWLNADDLLMPQALEQVIAAFQTTPRPDVVYGHCALLAADGRFLRYFHEIQPFSASVLLNRMNFIAQPSTFYTRAAYERVGGLDRHLHYAMDWDLWCRFARAGCRFRFLDEVLSGARYYADTKTGGGGLKRQAEILRVNRRHKTTRLPLAAAAHFYGDVMRPRIGWIHPVARGLWQAVSRRRFHTPALINGMAYPDRVLSSPVALRFPCFSGLRGARVVFECTGADPAFSDLQIRLNHQPGDIHHEGSTIIVTWQFAPPAYAASVDVELTLEGFAPENTSLRLRSVTLHHDSSEAPPAP